MNAIADSASGKNAYTFQCNTIGQQRFYAVCLRLINEKSSARLEALYPDCVGAIKKKTCPALRMRNEEIEKGEALYFRERKLEAITAPKNMIPMPVVAPIVESPKPKGDNILDKIQNVSYAETLNQVIKIQPLRISKSNHEEPPVVEVKQGESLLEMARRMLAAKSQR